MYKIMKIQYMFPENCWKIILYFVFEKLTSVIFIYILISVEKYCICMILQNSSQTNCILIYLTTWPLETTGIYPVPKEIDFPRYNIICSGENLILRGIFHKRRHFCILSSFSSPTPQVADGTVESSYTSSCNMNCSCSPTDFDPVCGSGEDQIIFKIRFYV